MTLALDAGNVWTQTSNVPVDVSGSRGHRGTGTVGDAVWLDEDEDGLIGEFEEPITDVEVTLLWWGLDDIYNTADDYEFDPEVTDDDGLYRFTDLPPGEYTLTVDTDGVAIDLDPTTPTSVDATLVGGATNLTADFGFVTDGELPFTGLAAEHLLLASALMIALGAIVFADGRKREKKFDIAVWRIGR